MPAESPSPCTSLDRLRAADQLLSALDFAAVPVEHLPAITEAVRRIQNRCTAATMAIAKQAKAVGEDPDATLLHKGNVSGSTAQKEAGRAETAEAMPDLARAVTQGNVSAEHVDAISRARNSLNDNERGLFSMLSPEVAEAASQLPVDTFKRKLRKLVEHCRDDHGLTTLQRQRSRSSLKMWEDADGMGHAHITGDPERMAKLRNAIERHTASLAAAAKKSGESVAHGPELQFDALIDLLGQAQGGLGRPTITILVDDQTLRTGPHDGTVCETESGVNLPIQTVERHLCDSVTQAVRFGSDGLPLDVGRRARTATPAQWAALNALYRTCAWHGCDRPISWCQAHHIKEWEHGGSTNLDNLIPLCSKHHHRVHDDGWRLRLQADRTLEIYQPIKPDGAASRSTNKLATLAAGDAANRSATRAADNLASPARRAPSAVPWRITAPDRRPEIPRRHRQRTQAVP